NAAFLAAQFWDGRAPTLEEQAKGPIQAHVEMDLTPEEAVERLRETGYEPPFKAAFPDDPEPLNFDNIAKAIAAFERTLITPGAPFDRYLAGDTTALTPLQKRGLAICQSAGRIGCHHGVLLGGNGYAAFTHVQGSDDVGRRHHGAGGGSLRAPHRALAQRRAHRAVLPRRQRRDVARCGVDHGPGAVESALHGPRDDDRATSRDDDLAMAARRPPRIGRARRSSRDGCAADPHPSSAAAIRASP